MVESNLTWISRVSPALKGTMRSIPGSMTQPPLRVLIPGRLESRWDKMDLFGGWAPMRSRLRSGRRVRPEPLFIAEELMLVNRVGWPEGVLTPRFARG